MVRCGRGTDLLDSGIAEAGKAARTAAAETAAALTPASNKRAATEQVAAAKTVVETRRKVHSVVELLAVGTKSASQCKGGTAPGWVRRLARSSSRYGSSQGCSGRESSSTEEQSGETAGAASNLERSDK